MMGWYDHDMGWWGYTGMGIGMVLIGVLVIGGIVAAIALLTNREPTPQQPPAPQPPTAEQILSARYARGEISESEYRERLTVLRNPATR